MPLCHPEPPRSGVSKDGAARAEIYQPSLRSGPPFDKLTMTLWRKQTMTNN